MIVLGIHDGHNASASLLVDGRLVATLQEERRSGKKNHWGFPEQAVAWVLRHAGVGPGEVDAVALAGLHSPRPADVLSAYRGRRGLGGRAVEWLTRTPAYEMYKRRVAKERLAQVARAGLPQARTRFVEHHLCHAASAYYGAPIRDSRDLLVLTCDGSGDGLCASVNVGRPGGIERLAATSKGHSVGNLYALVTFMLGLVPWEHEWKVMGMAPYAPEAGSARSLEVFRRYLRVAEGGLELERRVPEPTQLLYRRLRRDLELHRFDWICGGLQAFTEEVLVAWVRNAIARTGIRRLALAGGVFMNVKANKAILELPEVEELFVAPSCGDESNALGAAWVESARLSAERGQAAQIEPLGPIYLGPDVEAGDVEKALVAAAGGWDVRRLRDPDLETAELLARGEIVARCRGRLEFGARALGNRSILADPKSCSAVRIINAMVKKRDFWMPFAPVMLRSRQSAYIRNPKNAPSPYMMLAFDTTDQREDFVAAVHQADLTARAQLLEPDWNPGYARILDVFEERTGRGVLLNTSFNLHGEPMVCGAADALRAFAGSELRYLVLGDVLVSKRPPS